MRRLILLRHGETEGRSSVRFLGRTDTPLSEEGRAQARAVRDALGGIGIERAFTSRLKRAIETARIVLDGRGIEASEIAGFDEIDFGRLEGLTEGEIAEKEPDFYRLWRAEKGAKGYPDGDSFEGFRSRVIETFDRLEAAGEIRGTALVVAHRGTIRAILSRLLGPEADGRKELVPDLGGGLCLREEQAWKVERGWGLEGTPPPRS